jgi:hypothetical protein
VTDHVGTVELHGVRMLLLRYNDEAEALVEAARRVRLEHVEPQRCSSLASVADDALQEQRANASTMQVRDKLDLHDFPLQVVAHDFE